MSEPTIETPYPLPDTFQVWWVKCSVAGGAWRHQGGDFATADQALRYIDLQVAHDAKLTNSGLVDFSPSRWCIEHRVISRVEVLVVTHSVTGATVTPRLVPHCAKLLHPQPTGLATAYCTRPNGHPGPCAMEWTRD